MDNKDNTTKNVVTTNQPVVIQPSVDQPKELSKEEQAILDRKEELRKENPTVRNRPVSVDGVHGAVHEQLYEVRYLEDGSIEYVKESEIQNWDKDKWNKSREVNK